MVTRGDFGCIRPAPEYGEGESRKAQQAFPLLLRRGGGKEGKKKIKVSKSSQERQGQVGGRGE